MSHKCTASQNKQYEKFRQQNTQNIRLSAALFPMHLLTLPLHQPQHQTLLVNVNIMSQKINKIIHHSLNILCHIISLKFTTVSQKNGSLCFTCIIIECHVCQIVSGLLSKSSTISSVSPTFFCWISFPKVTKMP